MNKDLGTYHVRVELVNQRLGGYIEKWETGQRFSHGTTYVSPLNAMWIGPTWSSEDDLIKTMLFHYIENNGSCDCNKLLSIRRSRQEPEGEVECGDEITIKRLTVIRPDNTEILIYELQ